VDNIESTKRPLRELALFAGAGGGILGSQLLGWRTVCAVEIEEYCRAVLVRRQNEGHLEPFPIWDNVESFDGRPWRGYVDIISGGFPCQDISSAGKGEGITGSRSGLWGEMARIIGEVRPKYVFVENSPLLVSRGLGLVLGDLAEMGYNARWGVLGANDAGAPHIRKRIWILAYADCSRESQQERQQQKKRGRISNGSLEYADNDGQLTNTKRRSSTEKLREKQTRQDEAQYSTRAGSLSVSGEDVAYAYEERLQRTVQKRIPDSKGRVQPNDLTTRRRISWWDKDPAEQTETTKPRLGRLANGVAHRVDRIKALGNGQVPAVVRLAWETLSNLT